MTGGCCGAVTLKMGGDRTQKREEHEWYIYNAGTREETQGREVCMLERHIEGRMRRVDTKGGERGRKLKKKGDRLSEGNVMLEGRRNCER